LVTAAADSGGFARIEVASSGLPIDATSAAELFEPFRQGARSRTERRGSGLGLSIVQAIASAHGGFAVATPTVGGGLTVSVRLPVAVPAGPLRSVVSAS
jgi:signal transduction histidine kinase